MAVAAHHRGLHRLLPDLHRHDAGGRLHFTPVLFCLCRGLTRPGAYLLAGAAARSTRLTVCPLKIAITLAVIGVIVAEFISSSEGLGFLILKSRGAAAAPT